MIRLVIEMRDRDAWQWGGPEWEVTGNCTVDAFIGDNEDGLAPDELATIRALRHGEEFDGGGGAAPEWRVTAYEAAREPCAVHAVATPVALHLGQSRCPHCDHYFVDDDGTICGIVPRKEG